MSYADEKVAQAVKATAEHFYVTEDEVRAEIEKWKSGEVEDPTMSEILNYYLIMLRGRIRA